MLRRTGICLAIIASAVPAVAAPRAASEARATREQTVFSGKRDPRDIHRCIATRCSPPGIQRTNHCLKLLDQAHASKRQADLDAVLACGRAAFEADSACERQCYGP